MQHASIADMTRSWPRLKCPTLALRQASPWRRKTSATSSVGRGISGVAMPEAAWRCSDASSGTFYLSDRIDGDPSISRSGVDMPMPKQILDHPDVHPLFQQVSGEAMPQGVHGDISCLDRLLPQSCGGRPAPAGVRS